MYARVAPAILMHHIDLLQLLEAKMLDLGTHGDQALLVGRGSSFYHKYKDNVDKEISITAAV